MAHQCTKCGELYPDGSKEVLTGCNCGARFFYYIKDDRAEELKRTLAELEKGNIDLIESEIRDVLNKDIEKSEIDEENLEQEDQKPVILDLESVRVIEPGKFEIDIKNLLEKNRPLIYQLEEGKYIIDLEETFKNSRKK